MASSFVCKTIATLSNVRQTIKISRTHVDFLQNIKFFSFRSLSSLKQYSFTESYLMNSCGLSPETALSASQKVQLETSEKADSILAVLRDYGCTDTHISKIVSRCPVLLTANPEKTLLPKLEFFRSVGFSGPEIAAIVVSNPAILKRSLENHLIPSYNFLKSVVMVNENIVRAFKKTFWISGQNVQSNIAPNIATLAGIGVPSSIIKFLVTCHPTLVVRDKEKFSKCVKKVIEMGFNPMKVCFVKAVAVFCEMTESLVQHKMEVYRGWGFTDDQIILMFRLDPFCMKVAEKKIKSVMNLLVNEMGWEPAAIARYPTLFLRSLEKSIIPRCSVMKALQVKGLLKKDLSLCNFGYSEQIFLNNYVLKYEKEVPGLLHLYQGKTHIFAL